MKPGLARKLHALEPIIRIGKNGLTDNIVKDLKEHLKKRKLIKVKLLKSYIGEQDKKKLFQEIADKTESKIIQKIGFVIVLEKEEKNAR